MLKEATLRWRFRSFKSREPLSQPQPLLQQLQTETPCEVEREERGERGSVVI